MVASTILVVPECRGRLVRGVHLISVVNFRLKINRRFVYVIFVSASEFCGVHTKKPQFASTVPFRPEILRSKFFCLILGNVLLLNRRGFHLLHILILEGTILI